jgi:hypothetical protein
MAGARWTLLLLGLLIGGCAVKPPPTMQCGFVRHQLEVAVPPADASDVPGQLADVFREELATPSAETGTGQLPSMLFMSGGGEHGAFSAGILDEWAKRSPGGELPKFQVVTGISTGSILATFAFTGDASDAVAGYTITNETQLLTPYLTRKKDGKIEWSSFGRIAKHGAVANLNPLRDRIRGYLTDAVLGRVRDGHEAGRKLMVGVVDVDTGQGVALDLGEMGARYFKPGNTDSERAQIKTCYIEAIAASSSAPMAAVPAFIDNRMYVDGGMRFGMFADEIGGALRDHAASRPPHQRANVYLIANGTQETTPVCGKVDKSLCAPPNPPTGGLEGEHEKWEFLQLAMRSERILVNQVYRFSADKVRTEAELSGSPFKFAKIDSDVDTYVYTLNDPVLGTGTRTCAEWTALDQELLHPLQFYPRYMRCLIDYGRMRARRDGWGAG